MSTDLITLLLLFLPAYLPGYYLPEMVLAVLECVADWLNRR